MDSPNFPTVQDLRILRGLDGYPSLAEAAKRSVLQWRYRPAMKEGVPVSTFFTVVVDFSPRGDVEPRPDEPTPRRIEGQVRAPELIVKVEPAYPRDGLEDRIEGKVKFDAVIYSNGRVGSLQVVSGVSGYPAFVVSAARAVCRWRYLPATLDGVPIPVILPVEVDFRLNGD